MEVPQNVIGKKKLRRGLTVGAMGLAALAANAGTAHAGDDIAYKIRAQVGGAVAGNMSFVARGDSLVVCDTAKDGLSVTVLVYYSASAPTRDWVGKAVASGKGNCAQKTLHLKEGHKYLFRSEAAAMTDLGWARA